MHAEVPGAFTLPGEQETELGAGGAWMIVMVPPEPDVGIELPTASDATIALILTGTLELVVPAEIVKVAESYTGQYLARMLPRSAAAKKRA